jgi:dCMP deaminase
MPRMKKQKKLDALYLSVAKRCARMSYAVRKKVGAVIVKDENIIAHGWNGTPAGDDNICEELVCSEGTGDPTAPPGEMLRTKPTVLHAELNAILKLARNPSVGSEGATLYVTMSPCGECAKLIKQARIARVVYHELYRDSSGVDFLTKRGIVVEQHK